MSFPKLPLKSGNVFIDESPGKGRGVFAGKAFRKGEVIEIAPVITMSADDMSMLDYTELYNYYFLWGNDHTQCAIALGFGSVYNHSYAPNARYNTYYRERIIEFVCIKNIAPGEEITVNYNGEPEDQSLVWFDKDKKNK